jgi:ornithine cyclodeaminase/alanine dehydrogenase-like protein (mu-crystallin family)
MDKKLIEKIKDIVSDHLSNTEINDVELCEDTHDHYLLGKWDLAQEINDVLLTNRKDQ